MKGTSDFPRRQKRQVRVHELSGCILKFFLAIGSLAGGCVSGGAGLALSGCSTASERPNRLALYSAPLEVATAPEFSSRALHEVVVLPVAVLPAVSAVGGLEQDLSPEFISAVQSYTTLQVTNSLRPAEVKAAYDAVSKSAISPRQKAVDFARKAGADATLLAEITRFEESDGGRFGAANPSAVSLSLQLIDARTGAQLWKANYDRREEPLSDNILRIREVARSGVQFRSARELARLGFQEALRDLERRRMK